MITIGIDPGTAITGYCIMSDRDGSSPIVIEYGCIRTTKEDLPEKRLLRIHDDMKKLIRQFQPKCIAVEKLFFNSNTKTAMAVGQARGVVLLAAAGEGVDIAEYTPLQVKMALTGYGKADKKQVQQMVKTLLGLKEIPRPDDAADAIAVALCHVNSRKFNEMIKERK
jgi:crossover junction endodeoxyribonuclease RuvC